MLPAVLFFRLGRISCLENQLQTELRLTRVADDRGDLVRIGNRCGNHSGSKDSTTRRGKVRVVKDIEQLRAELQVKLLVDPRTLQHAKIGIYIAWTDNIVPAQVSDCTVW